MAGSGLVSDASGDIVFTTGNGTPPANGPGSVDNGALGQAQVRLRVQLDGTLQAVDHFAPYDASVLNLTDSDVGSGGVVALPTQYFGTAAHPRLMVTIGKQGYIWLTDATNMGGVGQGPLGSDAVLNRTGSYLGAGVRGKPAVWGGDGGYVYITTSQGGAGTGALLAYKYTVDGNGNPALAFAGKSADLFGFGAGSPVVTSDGTTSGSALIWTTWFPPSAAPGQPPGTGAQLRAYDAVPVNGQMVLRKSFPVAVATKFAVPGVDNGRLYLGTNDGHVLAFGSPIQAPLSGSTVSFPRTTVGTSSTATATVTADSALTVSSVSANNPTFSVVSTTPALPASLAAGDSMQVQLKFTPTAPGGSAAVLSFATSSGPASLSLSAMGQSAGPQLDQFPCCLSFGGVVTGSSRTSTVTFSNQGAAPLVINGYGMPSAPYTVTGLPPAGSSLATGQSFSVNVTFAPTSLGLFTDTLTLDTNDPAAVGLDGPNQTIAPGAVTLSGTGGTQPVMRLTPQDLNYGSVPVGTTATQTFSVTNTGGTDLNITISKVPGNGQGFTASTSLPESTLIPAGQTVTERVEFTPTTTGPAADAWAITGDDGQGRQDVTFHGVGTAAPLPTVSIGDLDVNRPSTGTTVANVPVTLSRAASSTVTMTYTTKDGSATTAGGDYVATSGTLTFAPGETSKTIPVTINGAQPSATAETLTVNLGGLNGVTSADGSAKLYLQSTYLPVSINVDDASAPAAGGGSTSLAFPVTVSPAPYPGQPVTVAVATADGTAIAANGDFTPVNTTLTFTDSTPTQTVTVPLLHNPASGASSTLSLNLSAASAGSNIADAKGIGTVYNNVAAPLPALYVSDAAVARPASGTVGTTFIVRLSRPNPTSQVTVSYNAVPNTGFTEADFDVTAGDLTFNPGETTKTVTVPVHGSSTSTGTGMLNLNIFHQSAATLADAGGKAYVVSPTTHAFVSVQPAPGWSSPNESTTVNVPVTLSSARATQVTATAVTAPGTAVAGTDYADSTSTLIFAPGQTTAFLPVTLLKQSNVQPTKTFSVKLSGATGTGATAISSAAATVTIFSHTADTTVPTQESAPTFTASTPPTSAMVGSAYDYTFAAGGVPAPSFAVTSGKLPAGLTLNALTGELSGTPTTAVTATFAVTANNTVGSPDVTPMLSITVVPPNSAPTFTADSPPSPVTAGDAYSYTFAASGNPAPTFTVTSGALPFGTALDSVTGILSGAPSTPGTYGFVVTASNGIGSPAVSGALSITVNPANVAPQLTAATPNPDATIGAAYSYTFAASGSPSPTFTIDSGTLPTGLSLDQTTGQLSGTPTTAGVFTFTIAANNGVGSPAVSGSITITVAATAAAPVFTAGSANPDAVVGAAYSYLFAASGVPDPTFAIASGALPTGLTLATSGSLSGTPTVAGTYSFTVRASNSQGFADSGAQSITVNPAPAAPVFTKKSPPKTATIAVPYSFTFVATGSPAPTFGVSSGALPPGLSLNPATGMLSGTPTTTGAYQFGVQASNGVGTPAAVMCTITVAPPGTADLVTTITGPASAVKLGSTITFTLNITNNGPDLAAQLVGSVTIPAGTTYVSSSPSVTAVNGVVTWTQPSLSTSSVVHWKVTVSPSAKGSYAATGTASSDSTDPNPGDNSATSASVTVK
jgi:uncharacterized repeat protein (TIGR01451 family)